jgi:tRNA(adenine34) deaminase
MGNFWQSLTPSWQVCLEEACQAICAGSLPIGAVVTDAQEAILSRGRNRRHDPRSSDGFVSGSKLAHAELNALIALPEDDSGRHSWILYTTTEPCPLCMGAFYMSGLRQLHYASYDPWAGSVDLLGATPYMNHKSIQAYGPPREDLENIIVGMAVYAILGGRILNAGMVLEKKRQVYPLGVAFGQAMSESLVLDEFQASGLATPMVYDQLAQSWDAFRDNHR